MSRNPLIPAKPAEITFDTLPQLFAHHRAVFGGFKMVEGDQGGNGNQGNGQGGQGGAGDGNQNGGQGGQQTAERPDGVSEAEWTALTDPGRAAIVREREARQAAERALAASRARPAPPGNNGGGSGGSGGRSGGQNQGGNGGGQGNQGNQGNGQNGGSGSGNDQANQNGNQGSGGVDVGAIVKQAVEAALKPFQEREEQRETQAAVERVQQVVIDTAKPLLHDATDALSNIDLTTVVNDQGGVDNDKLKTALDDLVKRKPHLARGQRQAPPGIGGGAPAGASEADKVKAALADMQRATGVRIPSNTN